MTREEAILKIKSMGEELPRSEISLFCKYVNISESQFFEISNSFRNKDIWETNASGIWHIKDFLIKDWKWA